MAFVVMATANHYFFDIVTGWMAAVVSVAAAHYLLAPARPQVWSFSPPPAEPAPVPAEVGVTA